MLFDPIETLIKKREQNDRETEDLATARDLLLPRLMSGEIRVRDGEDIVGKVA